MYNEIKVSTVLTSTGLMTTVDSEDISLVRAAIEHSDLLVTKQTSFSQPASVVMEEMEKYVRDVLKVTNYSISNNQFIHW